MPVIEHEIAGLAQVGRTMSRPQPRPAQRTAARQAPSLAAPAAPPMQMVGAYAPGYYAAPDDSDIFID